MVNTSDQFTPALHGMTMASIDFWKSSLERLGQFNEFSASVVTMLQSLSKALRMEADSSREVFSEEELSQHVPSKKLLKQLQLELKA